VSLPHRRWRGNGATVVHGVPSPSYDRISGPGAALA